MRLSIAMIVKNEEKIIEETLIPLKKLEEYIDLEIIIVDTGSTDKTVEVCKKYTDKIYFNEWNNDFSAMRNISISYCKGDWILVVDADEVLYDVEGLCKALKSKELNKYNAGLLKRVEFSKSIDYSINNGYISSILRLFKKDSIKYEGIIHEQPQFMYPVIELNVRFVHYGYNNNDYIQMEYKFERNLKLLLQELQNNPENVYIIFQIAVSYKMHKQIKESLKYIKIAYEKGKKEMRKYIYVIDKYCFILYSMNNYEDLIGKAQEGIKYCNDFLDFYFYLGEAYFYLNRYNDAIITYKKYLDVYDKFNSDLIISNNTLAVLTRGYRNNVLYNLALCYYNNGSYIEALNAIKKIKDDDIIKSKLEVFLKIIIEGKQWNSICELENYIDKYNYEKILFFIHNEVSVEDLVELNKSKISGELKEIIYLVKSFKENNKLNDHLILDIKNIINKTKMPYLIYIFYILKNDISEINNFLYYGKDKIENILMGICSSYFDFNGVLLEGLKKIKPSDIESIIVRTIMGKSLLIAKKLPDENRKQLFLNYIAEKYYVIIKFYNMKLVENNTWMLSSEDRFIVELKKALYYEYEDNVEYIKSIKNLLNLEKSYMEYIKLLIKDNSQQVVNNDIKAFIPELVKNIEQLIINDKYQEAYDTIEEGLSLVKFDFDLMILKYKMLLEFNYEEEAIMCLNNIILYGEAQKVNKFIEQLN